MPQQQQPKQEECSKKVYRGHSAENNQAQIDIKARTPEMIRKSQVPNNNRTQKSYSIVTEFNQYKNRTSSQLKSTKEITPNKKQSQPIMQCPQRQTIKYQIKNMQQKLGQEKSKNNLRLFEVNKLDQRVKTQQNENQKEKYKIIKKMPLKKVNQINNQSQIEKYPQIMSTRQIPSRQSFSPSSKISKTNNTTRGHSPSNNQNDTLNGNIQALLTVIRPIFKEAKYYQTSVIHFLRQEFFPNTSPYQVQFKIEFQDQKDYFKTKFCEHFYLTYESLKYCSQMNSIKPFNNTKLLLNPPKKPNFSTDDVKTLVFDLDETLIHCYDNNNNNPAEYKTIIKVPNEPEIEICFNIRPHCQQMLKVLSQFYELILFTASYKEYADKILEYIDPKQTLFSYRFYRESCLELEEGIFVKDLRAIEGRKLENMAIIDNCACCYIYQLDNGIPIIPFKENKQDKELIFLTDYLIKCEKQVNWLQNHKFHFQNQRYLQYSTIEECIQKFLQKQNY